MLAHSPQAVFQIANPTAMIGWIWLLFWLFFPKALQQKTHIVGLFIPLLLAVLYAAAVLVYFSNGNGGFDSLDNVVLLFSDPGVVLAGWVHYLSFDLFVGWCVAKDSVNEGINPLLIIPCLLLTFMFGPIGLLMYVAVRLGNQFGKSPSGEMS